MRRSRLSLVALVLVVVAGIGFAALFELRTEVVEHRFTGEARSNPLLAARRVLRRMGIDARTALGVEATALEALAYDDVIFVLDVPVDGLPRVAEQFETWIGGGGRLIIGLTGGARRDTPDEASSGGEAREHGKPGASEDVKPSSSSPVWQGAWRRLGGGLTLSRVHGGAKREETLVLSGLGRRRDRAHIGARTKPNDVVRILTTSHYDLEAQEPWRSRGSCLADRGYGEGRLYVLCASSLWMNQALGELDHAKLLAWLTGRYEPLAAPISASGPISVPGIPSGRVAPTGGRVWLALGVEYPRFLGWLWARVPFGLLGGVMLLLAWLWTIVPRFGPLRDSSEPGRRSVIENVEASARFQWRQGAIQALLEPMLEEIERGVARHYPAFRHFDSAGRLRMLEELLGADGVEVSDLLRQDLGIELGRKVRAGELVRWVRTLERVRRRL